MIHILICDDHDMVRTGLARVLQSDNEIQVVAECAGSARLLEILDAGCKADVLLLDLSLGPAGVAGGMDAVATVHQRWPALAVLVLSMHNDPELISRALEAGAQGYVTKESPLDVLLEAIRQLHRGRRFLDPHLVANMVAWRRPATTPTAPPWDDSLTPRERDVMARICRGQRLSDIADDLGLSIKTVSTHKVRLMEKLGIANNAELIKVGMRHGLG